jgi:ABC-type sulfate/molybdate transport systems ATPase subunit
MRQRVAFLRTLLAGKGVLLLDEPFASLDALTREELGGWLAETLDQEPRTVVLVTHDVDEALRTCERVAVLSPRPGRLLLDKIDAREKPEKAAVRELREETGLEPESLYNVTVSSFYLHASNTIEMCLTFAAFVADDAHIILSEEHQKFEWLSIDAACERFTWPREANALRDARHLLASGNAGPVEDVLRVR